MKSGFTVQASESGSDVYIYAPIGAYCAGGVGAKTVIDEIRKASSGALRVHINSPGGDPFDAYAIAVHLHNERQRGRTVETVIEGICASAATVISSAGKPIRMHDGALGMIHMPYMLTLGDADDHRRSVTELEGVTNSIVSAYRWTSSKTPVELRALMEAETWFDADEGIRLGLVHERVQTAAVAASLSSEAVAHLGAVPERYRAQFARLTGQSGTRAVGGRGSATDHGWRSAIQKSTQTFGLGGARQ